MWVIGKFGSPSVLCKILVQKAGGASLYFCGGEIRRTSQQRDFFAFFSKTQSSGVCEESHDINFMEERMLYGMKAWKRAHPKIKQELRLAAILAFIKLFFFVLFLYALQCIDEF